MELNPVATIILAVLSVLLSLVFKYVPSVATWYYSEKLESWRGLIMVGLVTVIAVVLYPVSCYTPWNVVSCDLNGVWSLLAAWAISLTSNQVADRVSPSSKTEKEVKATYK